MAPRKLGTRDRIQTRPGTSNLQAYLQDYSEVGGRRWESLGTPDWDEAFRRLEERLEELERRRAAGTKGVPADPLLIDYAIRHFDIRRTVGVKRGRRAESTILKNEQHVGRALDFLDVRYGNPAPRLSDMDGNGKFVTEYILWLSSLPGVHKGTSLSASTILKHVYSLSEVLKRAVREGVISSNPIPGHDDLPEIRLTEAVFMEAEECYAFLDVCRTRPELSDGHGRDRWSRMTPHLYAIFMAFAYTGGRKDEVLGLEVSDLDFFNNRVWFRPNSIRPRLKRHVHKRWVPMWPDLRSALVAYLERDDTPSAGQLFLPRQKKGLIDDLRAPLATICGAAGIEKRVTLHTFRHTYAAIRLQTTDNGMAVSPHVVMKELGHTSWRVFQQHYAHVLNSRPRFDEVAYRKAEANVTTIEDGKRRLRRAK
jgi:integrase